jgi:uncharacterized protein YndB with AHSA1/START domain
MTDEPQRHLTLSWTLDAPRTDVFRAWTDPDHLQWFYNPAQPIPDDPIELDPARGRRLAPAHGDQREDGLRDRRRLP